MYHSHEICLYLFYLFIVESHLVLFFQSSGRTINDISYFFLLIKKIFMQIWRIFNFDFVFILIKANFFFVQWIFYDFTVCRIHYSVLVIDDVDKVEC